MLTKKNQNRLSESTLQLLTDGVALSLTHPKHAELKHHERETLKQMKTAKSLENLQRQDVSTLNVNECFNGTNVQTAMRIQPEGTRAALISMLVTCCKFVDANKTLSEAEEFEMTLNELLRGFPCFTIEDWRLCTYNMAKEAYGPYYERLKLAQFVECFRKYENQRQPIVDTIRENERKDAETAQAELMRYIQPEYATAKEPTVRDRVDAVDWFKGENRLTYTERQEMDERLNK
jgi:hypothetical protein